MMRLLVFGSKYARDDEGLIRALRRDQVLAGDLES